MGQYRCLIVIVCAALANLRLLCVYSGLLRNRCFVLALKGKGKFGGRRKRQTARREIIQGRVAPASARVSQRSSEIETGIVSTAASSTDPTSVTTDHKTSHSVTYCVVVAAVFIIFVSSGSAHCV